MILNAVHDDRLLKFSKELEHKKIVNSYASLLHDSRKIDLPCYIFLIYPSKTL